MRLTPVVAGGFGTSVKPFGHQAGRYYLGPVHQDGTSAHNLAKNEMTAHPFYVPYKHTYDRIAVYVTVMEPAAIARLGVYEHDESTLLPGVLALDAGTVSIATTGTKEIAMSLQLTPGWYWLAVSTSTNGTGQLQGSGTLKGPGLLGYNNANPVAQYYFVSRSLVYGVLPDPFGGTPVYKDLAPPRVWLRG